MDTEAFRSSQFKWAKFRPDKSHRECRIHQASIVIFECKDEYKMYQRQYLIQNSKELMNPSHGVSKLTAIH